MSDSINFYQGQTDLFSLKENGNEVLDTNAKIERIKERVSEFFNMKNIHFLFGSGTSCDAIPNMVGLFKAVQEKIDEDPDNNIDIKAEFVKICSRIKNSEDLEDILGILYSHRAYLDDKYILLKQDEEKKENPIFKCCNDLIKLIEGVVFEKINIKISIGEENTEVFNRYKEFYRKLAFRNKDLSRINIFTTNNDLYNESALDNLNIHFVNGFGGGLNRYFNPALFNYTFSKRMDTSIEKFEPVENMVYLYKLHGSVNWIEDDENANTFFNIKEVTDSKFDIKGKNVLIYPTPTKQNKSLGSPYVELFREFQKKLMEPHSVLFVIGYSFSDEHVNNLIYQALATNSTMNIVVFNSLEGKEIAKNEDNRIFRIWGVHEKEIKGGENEVKEKIKIHYFDNIVKEILPNIDAFKNNDKNVESFIEFYRNNLSR